MLTSMFNAFFGCSHRRTTFPLTPARRAGLSVTSAENHAKTYVACLDCGKEFDYDWTHMRVGMPLAAARAPISQESLSAQH